MSAEMAQALLAVEVTEWEEGGTFSVVVGIGRFNTPKMARFVGDEGLSKEVELDVAEAVVKHAAFVGLLSVL